MNPFLVLNLPPDCTDEQVRGAYHELLRKYPPELFPAEFQMIQESATALKTARDRWRCHLFQLPSDAESPLGVVKKFSRLPGRAQPPGLPAFKSLLRASASAARQATKP
jgi:curved DNA-binding protein CbpA